MELTAKDKDFEAARKRLEAEYGHEFTDEEVCKAIERRERLCELMRSFELKRQALLERLKSEPKGFHLTETYRCRICGDHVSGDASWFDHNDPKCMLCQKAVDDGVVPPEVCHDDAGWYSMDGLTNLYEVGKMTVNKLLRLGKLKARVILDADGNPHFYVFLIAENLPVLGAKPEIVGIRVSPTCTTYQRPLPRELLVPGVTIPKRRATGPRKPVPLPQNWVCISIFNKNLCETPIRDQNDTIWDWTGRPDSVAPEKRESIEM
ncbi:MAG: hypothetical protein WC421_05795 [Elusimicrobiales bacterium]